MFDPKTRYKDVIMALGVANKYGESLGRLQLQWIIYLADTLSLIWGISSLKQGHQTYKNGPYDLRIQNAIDVLAFRGLVDIKSSNINLNKKVAVNYMLNDIGSKFLYEINQHDYFANKYELYKLIAQHINKRGWYELINLAYAEPNYVKQKAKGWGRNLYTQDILKNDAARIVLDFNNLLRDKRQLLSKQNLVYIFFKILDNYIEISKKQSFQG